MKETKIAFCLLITILVLTGPCFAISQARSGPFTVTVDSPAIGSQPPQTLTARDGEQFTVYEFNVEKGIILITEYPTSITHINLTDDIKNAYFKYPDIKQQDIQVQSHKIDGQLGVTAKASSPKRKIDIFSGDYLYDEYTKIIIVTEGDAQLFDRAIKSIHVKKIEESNYPGSQTITQSSYSQA